MGLVSKIRRARSLTFQEWSLLLQATGLLWRAAWLVRRRSMSQLVAWTDRGSRSVIAHLSSDPRAIADIVGAATRLLMPAGSCLPRSLVTCRLLKQAGHRASLVIGARASENQQPFAAHAWVQVARHSAKEPPLEFNRGEYEELVKLSKTA